MSYEQEIQQTRDLLDNFNQLDDETRGKLANGVEWLAFIQKMAKADDAPPATRSFAGELRDYAQEHRVTFSSPRT